MDYKVKCGKISTLGGLLHIDSRRDNIITAAASVHFFKKLVSYAHTKQLRKRGVVAK